MIAQIQILIVDDEQSVSSSFDVIQKPSFAGDMLRYL